jgi:hypothetical protein
MAASSSSIHFSNSARVMALSIAMSPARKEKRVDSSRYNASFASETALYSG